MNEKEWMRVADLLCQIRHKYANLHIEHNHNWQKMKAALKHIETLLSLNEQLADAAYTGWL